MVYAELSMKASSILQAARWLIIYIWNNILSELTIHFQLSYQSNINMTQFWDLPECHERQAMSALVKVSVEAISKSFASLLGFSSDTPKTDQEKASKAVACLIHCFTPEMWPCETNEVIQYGKDQLTYLLSF